MWKYIEDLGSKVKIWRDGKRCGMLYAAVEYKKFC
jgi:hypothetical protein